MDYLFGNVVAERTDDFPALPPVLPELVTTEKEIVKLFYRIY
jgi:hypothetical protein